MNKNTKTELCKIQQQEGMEREKEHLLKPVQYLLIWSLAQSLSVFLTLASPRITTLSIIYTQQLQVEPNCKSSKSYLFMVQGADDCTHFTKCT